MIQATKDIWEAVGSLFTKLEDIEHQVKDQELEMETQRLELLRTTDINNELALSIKTTRTSIELLRDEIEELQQIIEVLIKGKR